MQIKLKTGHIIKIYTENRGHDYVIIGIRKNRLKLLKNNCIKNDGTIHESTTAVHKTIFFEKVDGVKIAKRIFRVVGERKINKAKCLSFLNSTSAKNYTVLKSGNNIFSVHDKSILSDKVW